jgi:Fe-Mn family superoxide dismutase
MEYTARTFDLPELKGLSAEQIKVHLALYEGYVKHVNLIMNKIKGLREADAEGNAFLINELRRRLSFEFDGMRMHEYYFDQFVGGAKHRDEGSALYKAALDKYGAQDLVAHVKEVAGTRGIGWVVVYWDGVGKTLHTQFVNDHELGQLAGLPIILALDLWEHAYMVDYRPAQKMGYVDAFFENLNWAVCEERFQHAQA